MILNQIKSKILSEIDLLNKVDIWKANNEAIVFTNGCFDLIHPGHVSYLANAADCGTKLIIGLNSDSSVSKLKGKNRPILDENARALILASLAFVDAIVFFDEDTPIELIRKILPDILVKGKDYKAEEIVGYAEVIANGGKVETIELVPGYSTSLIEQKIKNS